MKKIYAGVALAALIFSGCGDRHEEKIQKPTLMKEKSEQAAAAEKIPSGEELYGVSAQKTAVDNSQENIPGHKQGVVLETMDAGVYTYAKVNDGNAEYWIAGPKTSIKTGVKISFAPQMWMENFHSKTLNRTFDKVLFVAVIAPLKSDSEHNCENCGPKEKSTTHAAEATKNVDTSPVAKAEGGYTIAEIFAQKEKLKDKTIKINGRVTKVIRGVMGKDWVHIQDGSSFEDKNDLVVTSVSADVSEGDTVTVTGKVKTDVDFGYGYFYPVLIEEATLKKQS